MLDHIAVPHKITFTIDKYAPGHEPDDCPDEVVRVTCWMDTDGTEISDPARIAELEAGIARQEVERGADQRVS